MTSAIHAKSKKTTTWVAGSSQRRSGSVFKVPKNASIKSASHAAFNINAWDIKKCDELIKELKHGYPINKFDSLKKGFGVNSETLSRITNISLATMHRRKNTGRFTPDESEKLYRLIKLYQTAFEVLETEENVKVWFNTQQIVFDGKTPLEYADTLPGSEEVEKVLRRMEQGIVI